MLFKDYYKILELAPGASIADIKKSYRRLALLYHPDRNLGSNVHEAKFKEVKEAYEVLSNAGQRQEYNARRREQSQAEKSERKKSYQQPTAHIILAQTIEFRKKLAGIDPERVNKRVLYHRIQNLISIQNILILKHSYDDKIKKRFINEVLHCSQFLLFPEVEKICVPLLELAGTDNESYQKIYQFSKQSRFQTYWSKYKLLAAVIVALVLCFLIYLLSTNF